VTAQTPYSENSKAIKSIESTPWGNLMHIEEATENVYDDIHSHNAEEMLFKARLAATIGEVIKQGRLTHGRMVELTGLPQPKISALLKGQFRDISEAKMQNAWLNWKGEVRNVNRPYRYI
jgi:predicted XRE-type DNA-binding protein